MIVSGECDPKEIALKSFFLGPQAENAPWIVKIINDIFGRWIKWRRELFPQDGSAISIADQETFEFQSKRTIIEKAVTELVTRFEKEVPKFSPRYVGHMFSEVSLPALVGHIVTLLHNPNNISGEVSRVGIEIEDEAVKYLLEMLGYSREKGAGHFTSGGTIANMEAVMRAHARLRMAENTNLKPVMLVPENRHYSWQKACYLFRLGTEALWPVELDKQGRLSVAHLKILIEKALSENRPILLVVSVVGTTELGGIDPVDEVQNLLDEYKKNKGLEIWHHVDGAYGGLFATMKQGPRSDALRAMSRTQSITLDPHKLGYVPYASGAFLVKNKEDYYFSTSGETPYIDFNKSVDKGPFTIEGSRSAAGAVATWMTAKTMGFHSEGYGLLIERTMRIKEELTQKLINEKLPIQIAPGCDTNILCFSCALPSEKISISNQRSLKIYNAFSPKQNGSFIVSKTSLKWSSYKALLESWTPTWEAERDANELVLVRMCMMNPFFGSKETKTQFADFFVEELKNKLKALL